MSRRRTAALVGPAAAGAVLAVFGGGGVPGAAGGAVIGGALVAAGRHPRAAWIATVAATLAMVPRGMPDGVGLLIAAQAFFAGRGETRRGGIAALAALVGALELEAFVAHDDSAVPWLLIPAAVWGAGRALRERELVAAELTERARELEEEHEAHAALSVRYERARIASELHDVVAHAISVMVVQASAGQRLARHDPQSTAETFGAIAGAARQAEADMGRLVALLGDGDAIGPAPDLALVEAVVARAASSGLDVTLRLEGDREGLPAPAAQAAYHVVREGLTNALRYAAGAAVEVLVRGDREGALVVVTNDAASAEAALVGVGSGTGLQGLRERVGACGGTLDAGSTATGGWRLSARIPRRAGRPRMVAVRP